MFPERRFSAGVIGLFLTFIFSGQGKSASSRPIEPGANLAPPPHWVKQVRPSETSENTLLQNRGTVYLLVDRQVNLEPSAFYYHEVRKITSENGVQNSGSISVSFEPS